MAGVSLCSEEIWGCRNQEACMGELRKFYNKTLPDIALNFFLVTIRNLLQRQTVRSAIRGQARKIITGSREKQPYTPLPTVERYADRIVETLNGKGIFPTSICIDGLPGSGKSTLSRALADRYNLTWRTLLWHELGAAYPFKKGRIYESTRLVRTQNMEDFDIVIYIDCPEEMAQNRVITRDRNAALADVVDFPKFKKIGDAAFRMLGGRELRIEGSPIRIKRRPRGGYKDLERLKVRLQKKGFDVEGFSKEELYFIYCYGAPQSGLSPYLKLGAYNSEILSGIYEALVRSLGKRFLT
jgi:hypothetical protein